MTFQIEDGDEIVMHIAVSIIFFDAQLCIFE